MLLGRIVFSRLFLTFSIDKKKKKKISQFIWLSFTFNLCHSVCLCPLQKDPTTTAARGTYIHAQYTQHTHTRVLSHTQYGRHTQAAVVHSPLLVLMNGPSLNYFVQISFRPLKKRSCLFIHFTFAPRLQYLRLCLQRIYPPPVQEEREKKKTVKEKDRKRQSDREGERKKQFTQCT